MNVRFAEPCRSEPLDFFDPERKVLTDSYLDGCTQKEMALTCHKDIFIGVFFDGTNNNKYRDTPNFSHSNVARLYEVYAGTNAAQKAPTLKPKVKPDGSKEPRLIFPDEPFKADFILPEDLPYYRKIYVPGLGTPMPDARDSGTGAQKAGGLAMALLSKVRLDWALLQLVNQVHAAIFKAPLEASVDMGQFYKRKKVSSSLPLTMTPFDLGALAAQQVQKQLQDWWDAFAETTGTYDAAVFDALLDSYMKRLGEALKARGNNKPDLRKIRLSVFGFSRGAAEARAWVNMVNKRWGDAIAGIPLQIDFLGIFDTVASVGFAHSTPPAIVRHFGRGVEGHLASWSDITNLTVPPNVKRCVHLVAAFEVRGSFPLDSICRGSALPINCKEIVYPGVHSDVGGGYPPDDQGRALGQGAAGDKFKLSQISLAQMYREARMAGVPLAPAGAMKVGQAQNFAIATKLREDFNAYIDATRTGSVPPTQGKGLRAFADMFPTETQPRGELHQLMRQHYGILLRWRKSLMNKPGGIAGLLGLMKSASASKYQDAEDFRGAEQELRKEITFLESKDPKKFDEIDDVFFKYGLDKASTVTSAVSAVPLPIAKVAALVSMGLYWEAKRSLRDVMREKQKEWDTWLHEEWASHASNALPKAAETLFEHYVHDSRAWFKPFMRTDVQSMVPDDEEWFVFGGREQDRQIRIKDAQKAVEQAKKSGDKNALASAEKSAQQLQKEGQPLLMGGREPYRMWGYVRHRRIYQASQLNDPGYRSRQAAIEQEEQDRIKQKSRDDQIGKENARHDAEIQRLRDRNKEVLRDPRLIEAAKSEFTDGTRSQIAREKQFHAERLQAIEGNTTSAAH
jgi:hypothetical protein